MARHAYRGKRQPIPRDYRHKTHSHRSGDGGCWLKLATALVVSVVVLVGMITGQ